MGDKCAYRKNEELKNMILEALEKGKDVFSIPDEEQIVFNNFIDARENLLNWYPFKEGSDALELGAGMGALTGVLCRYCGSVTAFEHSSQEAEIIKQRYKHLNNLQVVSGDLNAGTFTQKFDYIIMADFPEGLGTSMDMSYVELFDMVRSFLKENGILLLAVDNCYGMKFWCGAAEDHTGLPFGNFMGQGDNAGVSQNTIGKAYAFSKYFLQKMLERNGFSQVRWYYPLPNYKFPMTIFSDEYLPTKEDIETIKFDYIEGSQLIADEKKVYIDVVNSGVFPFFANSFLLEATRNELPGYYVKYASLKRDFKEAYRLATLIDSEQKVIKKSVGNGAQSHLEKYCYIDSLISKRGIPVLSITKRKDEIVQQWENLPRADVVFVELLSEGKLAEARKLLFQLEDNIRRSSSTYSAKKCTIASIDIEFKEQEEILFDGYIDMIFSNCFLDKGKLVFFDQEWRYNDIPIKFILYRTIERGYKYTKNISQEEVLAWVNIDDSMVKQFQIAEEKLLVGIMDERKCNRFDPNMYHEGLRLQYQQEQQRRYLKELEEDRESRIQRILQLQKEVEERNAHLGVLDKEIELLKRDLEGRSDQIELLQQDLVDLERAWEMESQSKTYRLTLKLRNFSVWLLPEDSKRRFVARFMWRTIRHPIRMLKLVNPRRIKNGIKILCKEGGNSAQNHLQLIEEYEKSRNASVPDESIAATPISTEEKAIESYPELTFELFDRPQVSIVIPVYNQFEYTYHCLQSIQKNSDNCSYEIILADDCSTDNTQHIDKVVQGIRIIHNERNLHFLLNCNNAAQQARGEYILFLNNDTQVQENWLSALIELMEQDASIGMVGSKLVYPDGYLQEAGGILWKDASAWNYGNRQNPKDSEFNYVHEADYISGAAIMIRTDLWKKIGGFDTRFVPAYCEDSDLAFEVRRHGYRVVYQPKSVVVHFEGISNGTDLNSGQKKYQIDNQQKFYEKWKEVLEKENFDNGTNVFVARDRSRNKKHVLVIDHYVPQYDKDAGSKTTYMYLKMMVKKGFHVTFLGDNFYQHEPYTTKLQQMGILVLYGPKYAENIEEWLLQNIQYFDVFYLNRPHITIKYIDLIKEYARGRIIYYGHDLHFMRVKREYELNKDIKTLKEAEKWMEKEFYIMHKTDMNYYPSELERTEINRLDASIPVKAITAYIYDDVRDIEYDVRERNGLLFVGGFGHDPNLDAVIWFLETMYPEIYKRISAPFYIVGSNAPTRLTSMNMDGVNVKGYVTEEELQQLYDTCRMVVVPLRYGAGVKGKVVEALYNGTPVVTTPVGAEGIPGIAKAVSIQETEPSMIDAICSLYGSGEELRKMSKSGQDLIKENFSMEAVWNIVKDDFE